MNTGPQEISSPNEQRSSIEQQGPQVKPWHAILWALLCALIAEIVLVPIVDEYRWTWMSSSGRVAFFGLMLFSIHHFSSSSFRNYKPSVKNLTFVGLSITLTLCLVSFSGLFAASLSDYFFSRLNIRIKAESIYFLMPFATGALLLQSVLGLHYVMVFAISLALLIAGYFPGNAFLSAVCLVSCLVGSLSLMKFRSRSAFTRAGMQISLIIFVLGAFASMTSGKLVAMDSLVLLICALSSGIICAFLAAGFAPIVEHLGGYITDMRLIEMATIDHPLLKELSVQAPGTWNHSMLMGMMVESAADSIGANPVLARVGSYFHDIGKIKKPLYYIENSGGSENRHEKLSPSMSALIIRSHVKDGVDLAQQYKLPQAITDMIPQHHGTARIEYFFDKAKKEAEEAGEEPDSVDESLYRYPGPKPQTRESGILMLADGIEAATRTLTEPTFDRIQGLVQKMINKVFASGELNECDLTLRDLHVIAKSFTRVLSGIYHQRIAYAEPAEKVRSPGPEAKTEARISEDQSEQKSSGSTAESKELAGESSAKKAGQSDAAQESVSSSAEKTGKEDLKRLGITHN